MAITQRISGAITAGNTARVHVHHFLLLEGDESGHMLLEGDMQSGDDALELEGDAATMSDTATKRVTF